MKTTIMLGALALSTVAMPAGAQTIIAPTSGVVDVGGPGFGTLRDTINQAGLSSGYTAGVTDFDTYLAGNPTHTSTFSGFEWFSNDGTTSATVTYDFGASVRVDRLALWNEESSGIGRLILSGSADGVTFSQLGIYSPTDNPVSSYPADIFSFAAVSLRYARFEMAGCPQADPGTFTACAIGEVAFRTAAGVPEPATWGLMILGFGAIGGAMRRRATRTTLRTA
ncbi:coagulation factor 5/8 type domain-containing protein [Sphingomonas sp. Leaf412]|uniref:PEPxxWA-CTERM sorting domain-containing protein n=1 Tax=Sphingomonas sp. Leaf412 TaxID=1736370 RepID=UPI0006FAAFC5|nr:PEPxxWA-CTERM sorting domain-containing protein [Sphingomonas sp. Leaf412]KQT32140.1 coagulation factor 5/8 type domain-containing protein [Sphingomonas sp. Leaf412]